MRCRITCVLVICLLLIMLLMPTQTNATPAPARPPGANPADTPPRPPAARPSAPGVGAPARPTTQSAATPLEAAAESTAAGEEGGEDTEHIAECQTGITMLHELLKDTMIALHSGADRLWLTASDNTSVYGSFAVGPYMTVLTSIVPNILLFSFNLKSKMC
ncbi:hypothetical protein Ciccas_001205 [Cichlidogyrus casuarinus]|uniref:Uncharacterized protein n=1 Tax=Cichlidogyrus casuarinus TaxID=1844966 RepID=A0ABD2QKP8_9PLAT